MRKQKRILIYFFIIGFFLANTVPSLEGNSVKAAAVDTVVATTALTAKTTKKVTARETASSKAAKVATLQSGHAVIIQGNVTVKNVTWYRCKFTYNKKSVTGYIQKANIKQVKRFVKTTAKVNSKVTTSLNVRKSASLTAKAVGSIKKNKAVTVLAKKTVKKKTWYQIQYKSGSKTVKGWVQGTYITMTKTTSTANGNDKGQIQKKAAMYLTANTNDQKTDTLNAGLSVRVYGSLKVNAVKWYKIYANGKKGYVMASHMTITQSSFTEMLEKFPKSYRAAIQALHNKYPNWTFVAVNTGLDWNTVLKHENVVGVNIIQSNAPKSTTNILVPFSYLSTEAGAYDWSKDKYAVKDGTNWYSADSKVIAHYIDPRNFLTEEEIFQFEAMAYDTSQTKSVVTKILANTFMNGKYSVVDSATKKTVSGNYNTAFMTAGKKAGASPYFLSARVKQEVGVNGSGSTSGTYKGYEGIYNYYNIGAFDSASGNAIEHGLLWAKGGTAKATTYGRPWTNPYKSIIGGAEYIASQYIQKGQNTLYFQKFNVVYTEALFWHQYMTNVQAPYKEGRTTKAAYASLNIMSNKMTFFIPVYNNMPESVCKLPESQGNPNAFLSEITIKDDAGKKVSGLSPTFAYDVTSGYTLVVENDVSSITVSATPISKYATVTNGEGTYALKAGEEKSINMKTKAGNGTTKTYTIQVTRQAN